VGRGGVGRMEGRGRDGWRGIEMVWRMMEGLLILASWTRKGKAPGSHCQIRMR
jgi:hypothetical protein